jgi:heme-degrading monooxygenase HmoA
MAMHVRVTWGRVKPGRWDDYERAYREVVLAGQADAPGLQRRILLRDTQDRDTGGTLSFWDSAQAAADYERGELRSRVLPALQEFFAGDFVTHICEVRAASPELSESD